MKEWLLKVELDGEWEECAFASRKEALASFISLAVDYRANLNQAMLFPADGQGGATLEDSGPGRRYIN